MATRYHPNGSQLKQRCKTFRISNLRCMQGAAPHTQKMSSQFRPKISNIKDLAAHDQHISIRYSIREFKTHSIQNAAASVCLSSPLHTSDEYLNSPFWNNCELYFRRFRNAWTHSTRMECASRTYFEWLMKYLPPYDRVDGCEAIG